MRTILLSGIPELFIFAAAFIIGDGERLFSILIAAMVHELGHMAVARMLGIKLRFCGAAMAGLSLKYDFSSVSPAKEAAVCLAGPLAGIVSFLICYKYDSASYFAGASATLALFNLLPVSGLDGGGIAAALLSMFLPPDTVWRICRALSVIAVLIMWCTAVLAMLRTNGDPSAIAVSIYLIYRLFSE